MRQKAVYQPAHVIKPEEGGKRGQHHGGRDPYTDKA
jgi:hypothetical protein